MFIKNKLLLLLTILSTYDVILSAPQQYLSDNNNNEIQSDDGQRQNEVTQDIIPFEIIPVDPPKNVPQFRPYLPYNPFLSPYYSSYYPFLTQRPQNPVTIKTPHNVFLEYDENNNLVYNSTDGFKAPVERNDVSASIITPRIKQSIISRNKTFVTPVETIHKEELKTMKHNSIIIAETYIRPNEKPKTIIRIYHDPSQNRENVTIEDPEPNQVIQINSKIVNAHVVTPDPTLVPTTDTSSMEDIDRSNENPTETSGSANDNPFIFPWQGSNERITEETTTIGTDSLSDENDDDDDNDNDNDIDSDNDIEDDNQNDDYNLISEKHLKKINDKTYERIPDKWLNINSETSDAETTTTESGPIWVRRINTTPKMFAFEMPTPAARMPVETTTAKRGWFFKRSNNVVDTTTERLRFSFFR